MSETLQTRNWQSSLTDPEDVGDRSDRSDQYAICSQHGRRHGRQAWDEVVDGLGGTAEAETRSYDHTIARGAAAGGGYVMTISLPGTGGQLVQAAKQTMPYHEGGGGWGRYKLGWVGTAMRGG